MQAVAVPCQLTELGTSLFGTPRGPIQMAILEDNEL
jgi:hypothetical protein